MTFRTLGISKFSFALLCSVITLFAGCFVFLVFRNLHVTLRFAISYPDALRCVFLKGEERFLCQRKYVLDRSQSAGALSAQEYIIFAEKEGVVGINECHYLGHALGGYLVKNGMTAEEVFMDFLPFCTSGYAHGAIYALLDEKADHGSGVDIQGIAAICLTKKDPASGGCLHGVGHAIVSLNEDNIFLALKICDEIANTDQHDRDNCYDGAFMQNVFDFYQWTFKKDSPKDQYRKKDDPLFPCGIVEEKYRPRCYFMNAAIGTIASYKRGYITDLTEIGNRVPDVYKHGFWYGIGRASNTIFRGDQVKVRSTCQSLPYPAKDYCFGGASAQIMLVDGGSYTRAETFCRSLPQASSQNCLFILKLEGYPQTIPSSMKE